jgi:hypothetical protein
VAEFFKKLTTTEPHATVAPVWFGTTRMYHPVSEENLQPPTPRFRGAWGTVFPFSDLPAARAPSSLLSDLRVYKLRPADLSSPLVPDHPPPVGSQTQVPVFLS